jgi:hypothetical protein
METVVEIALSACTAALSDNHQSLPRIPDMCRAL